MLVARIPVGRDGPGRRCGSASRARLSGRHLGKPHQAQVAHFNAKKGEQLIVEVLGAAAGSPVDSVIEILDAAGKPVPFAAVPVYRTLRASHSATTTRGAPGIRLDDVERTRHRRLPAS